MNMFTPRCAKLNLPMSVGLKNTTAEAFRAGLAGRAMRRRARTWGKALAGGRPGLSMSFRIFK